MPHEHHQQVPPERTFQIRIPGLVSWAINEVFAMSLTAYLVFYLIDAFADSYISEQLNMNILLWVIIVSGVLSVWLRSGEPRKGGHEAAERPRITWRTVVCILALGIAAGAIVFVRVRSLGHLGWYISAVSAALVICLSFIMMLDDGSTDSSQREES